MEIKGRNAGKNDINKEHKRVTMNGGKKEEEKV